MVALSSAVCLPFVPILSQILGAAHPCVLTAHWSEKRRTVGPFLPQDHTADATEQHVQLATKLLAACLADLVGVGDADGADRERDMLVADVLSAYGVNDITEVVENIWAGRLDVHPVLLGWFPRLFPAQDIYIRVRAPAHATFALT